MLTALLILAVVYFGIGVLVGLYWMLFLVVAFIDNAPEMLREFWWEARFHLPGGMRRRIDFLKYANEGMLELEPNKRFNYMSGKEGPTLREVYEKNLWRECARNYFGNPVVFWLGAIKDFFINQLLCALFLFVYMVIFRIIFWLPDWIRYRIFIKKLKEEARRLEEELKTRN